MDEKNVKRTSKFLSLVLRHRPEKIGIGLDDAGWVDVEVLLRATARHGKRISRETLDYVVRTNDKQRFSFSVGKPLSVVVAVNHRSAGASLAVACGCPAER